MGNLLGSPVTEKETETGVTSSGLEYGVSSMQGWRIHMEDAHICQPEITVPIRAPLNSRIRRREDGNGAASTNVTELSATTAATLASAADSNDTSPSISVAGETIILRDHALFAVFDGHGGSYSAIFSGKNFVRVLVNQPKFQEYAILYNSQKDSATLVEESSGVANSSGGETSSSHEMNAKLLDLLECSFRDAFVAMDDEILISWEQTQNKKRKGDGMEDVDDEHLVNAANLNDVGNLELPEEEEEENQTGGMDDSGTTAVVVLVTPTLILCSNAGDSRAVYSKVKPVTSSSLTPTEGEDNENEVASLSKTIPLSYDHKPDDEHEHDRIVTAGGYVSGGRVDGDLAVSRGLGDFRFKERGVLTPDQQKVSPVPDLLVQHRSPEHDEYIVVACDGIWDVMSNPECTRAIQDIFNSGESNLGLACEEMLDLCLFKGSKDNMTTLIVKFPACTIGDRSLGGVFARRAERERQVLEEKAAREAAQQGECNDSSNNHIS
mmetsp:Transcript_61177/g.71546  ORF Transcript_61177/g.71546 Transcript_61177/m.71546 type:complete len:495 (-) Transcript_61177:138-1622(-)|eukprot:CAMPEP_0194357034 /NCGR_PEP_ID=MMETSP0174-20130528/4573_1 /TAXON_ID=216777 /ORGANISM="Proboscia alata, Strain PI-D3" /LENGTH=494 /DNA_ID=CAMNT_0039126883 /DNA_START=93 /DNA_END=1577 /DNA_ORIENTATION=+